MTGSNAQQDDRSARRFCARCCINTVHQWQEGQEQRNEAGWRCLGCQQLTTDATQTRLDVSALPDELQQIAALIHDPHAWRTYDTHVASVLEDALMRFQQRDDFVHAGQGEAADTQRLDKLEALADPDLPWIARNSVQGRGYRLHQIIPKEGEGYASAREAIDAVAAPNASP